jgi:hypothetical protein
MDKLEFKLLQQAVQKQWERMQAHQMFRVNLDKDGLWNEYLSSFPPGYNEVFRERREYDCNCCKQFVRAVGNVVAIIDGKLVSVWDVMVPAEPVYEKIAKALSKMVKAHAIADPFLHYEPKAGTERTFDEHISGKAWNHFFVNIAPKFVCDKHAIAPRLNNERTKKELLERALKTINDDAVQTVLDLIAQNSVYRGEEHKFAVTEFAKLKKQYEAIPAWADRELFCWTNSTAQGSVAGIRNTSIGTLLVDLSEGTDLEVAVKKFEAKVAPENYKRTTALVTPAMVAKAKEKVAELGLTSALARRYAVLGDITVNNVLWADRSAKKVMSGDVFDDLAASTAKPVKKLDKVEEVSIAKFLADILPKATSIEVLVENKHAPNLVSLLTADDATAGKLFKWSNPFSWSYTGEVADSDMRRAVREKGGRVDGAFRFTHQWNHDKRNASLMDLHVFMPGSTVNVESGVNDSYGNKSRVGWNNRQHIGSGGIQDVDYVNPAPVGYVPVENITFPDVGRMPEGRYICKIHNWKFRTPTQGGFRAEIEFAGQLFTYEYDKPMKDKEWVTVAEVTLKDGRFDIKHHLPHGETARPMWGLQSQQFQRVNVVCMSPNHWDGEGVGNKHYFFMLDGCANDGEARGFYNEFLDARLDPHRKVFEMVGSKLKPAPAKEQLSGLGFSSTQRNTLTVRVKGSFNRTVNIAF